MMLMKEILDQGYSRLSREWWCKRMFNYATKRSIEENRNDMNISVGFLLGLWHDTNGSCALTGIYFNDIEIPNAHRRPFNPSIDKIDCTGWYTVDNVRIVCSCVNTALSTWGDAVFTTVCLARMRTILGDKYVGTKT